MTNQKNWIYYKLYLGNQIDCADSVIRKMSEKIEISNLIQTWYYIRYIDEGGFHIRLRVQPCENPIQCEEFVREMGASIIKQLHDLIPSDYQPMVTLPDFGIEQPVVQKARVRMVAAEYEPEIHKYGSETISIAESLFCESTKIACQILEHEEQGLYSRKALIPWLMHEAYQAFPSISEGEFWSQYSLYWLGGDSPAANDWRTKFFNKAENLKAENRPILIPSSQLPEQANTIIDAWRKALKNAAMEYKNKRNSTSARNDVLSLNFAHLMMNRLGIATLEESYMATLLESTGEAA